MPWLFSQNLFALETLFSLHLLFFLASIKTVNVYWFKILELCNFYPISGCVFIGRCLKDDVRKNEVKSSLKCVLLWCHLLSFHLPHSSFSLLFLFYNHSWWTKSQNFQQTTVSVISTTCKSFLKRVQGGQRGIPLLGLSSGVCPTSTLSVIWVRGAVTNTQLELPVH